VEVSHHEAAEKTDGIISGCGVHVISLIEGADERVGLPAGDATRQTRKLSDFRIVKVRQEQLDCKAGPVTRLPQPASLGSSRNHQRGLELLILHRLNCTTTKSMIRNIDGTSLTPPLAVEAYAAGHPHGLSNLGGGLRSRVCKPGDGRSTERVRQFSEAGLWPPRSDLAALTAARASASDPATPHAARLRILTDQRQPRRGPRQRSRARSPVMI